MAKRRKASTETVETTTTTEASSAPPPAAATPAAKAAPLPSPPGPAAPAAAHARPARPKRAARDGQGGRSTKGESTLDGGPARGGEGASDDGDSDGDGASSEDNEPVADTTAEIIDEGEEPQLADEEDPFAPVARPVAEPSDEEAEGTKLALGRQDPLQAYLREVQKHPLLTSEEEHSLAVKYGATQDVNAAARLVTANLRLVVKIAYEYRRAYKNIMDLIQEGNIGLMQAVKKYDPNRGVKLSSYSAWWIRAYILRYIINNWRLVKLGTTQAQRKLFFNLNKEKAKLAAMGVDPSPSEIAKRLGVEEQEAVDMDRRLSAGEMSLDAPVGDNEGRPVARIELLPSSMLGPDVMVADEEMQDIVRSKLAEFRTTLKGKDVSIFDKRLMADEPLTLQELGDQFGISRERVRQIEARLTMNLRTFLREALGDAVNA